MRLKSIKLAGFKSFAEPTRFLFPGQITCIVGPNGCGKSNTLDAIRWVMGESTARALRGGEMNDVLFNGTDRRKPVSQASVELVFDNTDHRLKGPWNRYAELSVRRVHHREQGSQYYLNGQRCRKRDVQALFDGTGLGPRSYALIGQGNISHIIEARPEQLRLFLEEVAGVGFYRQRRKEALGRLEAAEENLAQLRIQYDTWRQEAEILEKQCDAAQTYQELSTELKTLNRLRYQVAYWQLSEQISRLDTELQSAQQTLMETAHAAEKAQKDLILLEKQLPQLQAAFEQARQQVHQRDKDLALLKEKRAQAEKQQAHWHQQRQLILAQQSQFESEIVQLIQKIKDAEHDLERLQQQLDSLRQALASQEQQLEMRQAEYAEQQQRLEQLKAQRAQLRQQHTQLQHELEKAQLSLQHMQAQLDTLQQQDIESRLARVKDQLDSVHRQQEQLTDSLQRETEQHGQLKARREVLEQKLQAAQRQLSALEKHQHKLVAQLEALEMLQQPLLQTSQALTGKPVAAQVKIKDEKWAEAVEQWLGARLEGVTDRAWHQPPPAPYLGVEADLPPEDSAPPWDKWTPLTQLLQAPAAILHEAQMVFCADDTPTPAQLALLKPGQQVLTRDGRRWFRYGVETPREKGHGFLARQHQVQALKKALDSLQQDIRVQREAVSALQAEYEAVAEQQAASDKRLQAYRAQRQQQRLEIQHLEREQARLEQQQARQQQQMVEIERNISELTGQYEVAEKRKANAAAELKRTEDQIQSFEKAFQQQQQALKALRQEVEQRIGERAQLLHRQRQQQEQLVQFRQQHQWVQTRLQQLQGQLMQLEQSQREMPTVSVQSLAEAEKALEVARAKSETARAALQTLEEQLSAQRAFHREAERSHLRSEQTLRQLEQQYTQLQQRLKQWVEEAQEADLTLAQLKQRPLQEDFKSLKEIEQRIKAINRQIAQLGPVNMTAIERWNELKAEMDRLQMQMDDVARAVETLRTSIHRMDRDSRRKLRETFDAVNARFAVLFPRVFNGGKAQLQWERPDDDPLHNGVHVMAQPPGKRTARIQMLSGGEKTLTALALIFAIFELNPAPFCVLDEVDAPLDDANVNRFCALVKSMAEQVQFILITHNKITMSTADQLLGVTMHEPGVSRVVSVDLKTALEISGEEDS